MTRSRLLLTFLLSLASSTAIADERYKVVRPVIIESGIAGQWMMQLGGPVRGQVGAARRARPAATDGPAAPAPAPYRPSSRRRRFNRPPIIRTVRR